MNAVQAVKGKPQPCECSLCPHVEQFLCPVYSCILKPSKQCFAILWIQKRQNVKEGILRVKQLQIFGLDFWSAKGSGAMAELLQMLQE